MSLSDNLRRLARERIPTGAGEVARSYHSFGAYQRFNSNQKQSTLCLFFLERFLDRSADDPNVQTPPAENAPPWVFRSIDRQRWMNYG